MINPASLTIFGGKCKKTLHFSDAQPIPESVNTTSQLLAKKILVVDDNPILLRALSLALGARGYEVFTAIDASEAFGFARMEKLDLILLDIFFPPDVTQNGMTWDAFRIIDWMQRVGVAARVPIVVISGAEPKEFEGRCLAAGAMAFFHKPINLPGLLDTIHSLFHPGAENEKPAFDVVLPRITHSAVPARKYLTMA